MEDSLAAYLRDMCRALNGEARLAGAATVEACMGQVLDGPGPDWLVDTAQALDLVDGEELRQNARAYRDFLCSDAGRQELRSHLAQRRSEIERWRRLIVAQARAGKTGPMPVTVEGDGEVSAGEVYSLLMDQPAKEG